ncbi:MAG: glycosyltransferase family 4 protein [Patescibacteria group bacterium]|nr:glycosyltransferase family 4 protein [Patescibacteria group bacterium]
MRIIIATGVYPPEIGGPALYAKELAHALEKRRHDVRVVLYGGLKRLPIGIRHALYTLKLLWYATRSDAIIAFDTFSVGFPATLAHMLTRTPLVVRIGGDAVWEMYVERTKDLLPLPEMYRHRERWNWKERAAFRISRFVLRRCRAAFSSEWLRDIWQKEYALDIARISVIENAILQKLAPLAPKKKNFILYSRDIALKNIAAFTRAFAEAKKEYTDIELETGTLPHAELAERMRSCYAVALPSISDITPNYIIDSIRCGKPFLLTKYSAYAQRFGEYGVIVDPLDEADMARGIEKLADPEHYELLRMKIAIFNEVRTYDDIAREFLTLITKTV